MKILIVAENASRKFGGEAILPLHYFRFMGERGHRVFLVTHDRVKGEIQASLSKEERARVFYVSDRALHRGIYKAGKKLPLRTQTFTTLWLLQILFQIKAKKIIRNLVVEKGIDIVHQPIPVSPKLPSLLSGLGAPVVIGPMNGGMTFPAGFKDMESPLERAFLAAGRILSGGANIVFPGKRKAAALLAANERTARALPKGAKGKVYILPENGVDLDLWDSTRDTAPSGGEGRPRIVYMGRLVPIKNVECLLQAFASLPRSKGANLSIAGDGPGRPGLESFAEKLGIRDRVRFLGHIPQNECASLLRSSTVLALPSLLDCGGAVVLEAMAASKPVVAVAWGGPLDYVTPGTGILVKPKSREQLVRDFSAALLHILDHPKEAEAMGREGRKRVEEHFDWRKKAESIEGIFREVLEKE